MVEAAAIESDTDAAPAETLANAVSLLAAIADPIRWQLVSQLAGAATRCVCDLRTDPEIPANLLSYHLKVLREAGLILGTRRGRWIDYRLTGDALDRLHAALPAPPSGAGGECRRPPADPQAARGTAAQPVEPRPH